MSTAIRDLDITALPLFRRGKVRDTYDLGDQLLMVASDRLSAYDVVLPDAIPDKGRVLTKLSTFWFDQTGEIIDNHLISADVADLPSEVQDMQEILRDRFMIVHKADRIDIECVVRGYLAGSAWAEYQRDGTVCGQKLPEGLVESVQLPEPIFTPATKADEGHDENISIEQMNEIVGADLGAKLISASMDLYKYASEVARSRGVILADTKFEFGLLNGSLILIDEIFTPDSSRFWDVETYKAGEPQESFDKQYVRDWLTESGWDRNPPAPPLPAEVIEGTSERYREAYERISGLEFDA